MPTIGPDSVYAVAFRMDVDWHLLGPDVEVGISVYGDPIRGLSEPRGEPAGPSLIRQRLALCSDSLILDRREAVSGRLTCDNEPSRKPIKPSALTAIWIELRSFPILQGSLNYR
jgi:hypothetical protein